MNQASSALRILIAAVVAVIFTIIAQLFLNDPTSLQVSLIALGTFLGGVLSPSLADIVATKRATHKARAPRATKRTQSENAKTLYVGNLPFKTDESAVEELFGRYGQVQAVRLVKDRRTGRKKGYGFVEMDDVGADVALAKLNDSDFEGRTLKVRAAHSEGDDE
ncbi:MAG: RNA-binding protein [Idiomarina sp.]|nr:RNA-binding protein [Idiomarina sp.]